MYKILITGGSRGIGAATAYLAFKKGYEVLFTYQKDLESAENLAEQIRKEGGKVGFVQADLRYEEEVKKVFAEVKSRWGKLDVLVNNAGGLELQSTFRDLEMGRWRNMFQLNFFSAVQCTSEALKYMQEGGSIVNVSSIAARTGAPGEYMDYASAKAALECFTKGLAQELGPEGIRVNAVRPAFIYTDIHADGGEAGRVDRIKSGVPLRRGGQAEEVAEAILWLASPLSSYSTGTIIDVTGGR
jgi:NAD(P)-dependent dehydrogenase (short-subunit alcohol dehydrogenase family)